MITKNKKGNIKEIKIKKVSPEEMTIKERIDELERNQDDIIESLGFIINQLQGDIKRLSKYN